MTASRPRHFARAAIFDDRGSGSVLALGILSAVLALAAGAFLVVGAGAAHARAAAAADLAALAAADVVSGRAPGVPCDVAESVVEANGAGLVACDQAGVAVTVTAAVPYAGLSASVSGRAGPPRGVEASPG
ncbi:Rv3654c family TadE-like protein [Leifsonia sp. 2TAF2]|uniref:Rv3654c family TadE-like protein n=1 Tax=Leifsonia sp. 2TAF2 TaxID=3233009 RepID=UPI003F985BA0